MASGPIGVMIASARRSNPARGRDPVLAWAAAVAVISVSPLGEPDPANRLPAARPPARARRLALTGRSARSMFDDDYSVLAAMRAGARGYVLKGAQQDEIIRAVHAVAAGEAIFGPGVARLVLGLVAAPPAAEVPFQELTGREREVLDLVAAGVRNAEIARRMSIAPKTVANHISAIFAKLQVTDRGEAIILARDAGLGRDSRDSAASQPGDRPE
jgi:DNA-binding NarL/FixJ family response regulator